MSEVIQFKGEWSQTTLSYSQQAQPVYGYFEMRPTASSKGRLPLNFVLVLDSSGSMSGEPMQQLIGAVQLMIDQLEANDYIGIVSFNHDVQLVAPIAPTTDKTWLKNEVGKLSADGTTNIGPALKLALQQAQLNASPNRTTRIILLTDGVTSREEACQEPVEEMGRVGIPLIALGLGEDWHEKFLGKLVQQAAVGGYTDFIQNPQDIQRIFGDVFRQISVVAKELTFRLLLAHEVQVEKVWQVSPLIQEVTRRAVTERTVAISLPDLSEAGAAYMVELILPVRQVGQYRFAQAEVSYTTGNEQFPRKMQKDAIFEIVGAGVQPSFNLSVLNIVERLGAYRLQSQAMEDVAKGNLPGATRKLREAHTRLLSQGEFELAQVVESEANRLEQGYQPSSAGKKTILLDSRKTVRLPDWDTKSIPLKSADDEI